MQAICTTYVINEVLYGQALAGRRFFIINFSMKVICWNVQGVKKIQGVQEVKFLAIIHKPDMLFLLETMINESNIRMILPLMGFEHFDFVSPVNYPGGIAVLWNNGNIYASVLIKETRAIHMSIHDPNIVQN